LRVALEDNGRAERGNESILICGVVTGITIVAAVPNH
jgi:hypothetical protein